MSQPYTLLYELRKGRPISVIRARQLFGILNPADAVYRLRKLGHKIETYIDTDRDIAGVLHKCAHYQLQDV